jgi:zinc-ribbon domain
MRFACQSCGKAYNLPEERIAEKSNVKLKCRVCGAIVEVKKQGELVAHVLDETEDKRMARVSEAPAPLTTISPDDDDDPDGATVSISEASINDRGPLELEIPGAAATGFSAAAAAVSSSSGLSSSGLSSAGSSSEDSAPFSPPLLAHGEAGVEHMDALSVAPSLSPPPLAPSSLPPPPALRALDAAPAEAVTNGSGSNGAALSHGSAAFFPDTVNVEIDESLTPELKAPVAAVTGGAAMGAPITSLGASVISPELAAVSAPEGEAAGKDPLFILKMLAAFATGVLMDRIVSGLFQ